MGLNSFIFRLKYQEICSAHPNHDILQNIDANQLKFMSRMLRSVLTAYKAKRVATLPDTEVYKLTPTTFEDCHTASTSVVGR